MCNPSNGIVNMKLNDQLVRSFQRLRDFPENEHRISGIDFSADGKQLVACENDEKVVVYDCDNGKMLFSVNTKKYGAGYISFNPKHNCVVYSSTKVNDEIRHLSLDTKNYLRFYAGHTGRVISLSMSPHGHSFLSGSIDRTVRLWDLNSSHSQAVLHSPGPAIAAHDPEGIIFAAGVDSEFVKLYDLRSFEKGPFATFKVGRESDCEWTGMNFSADGKTILISTNGQWTRLIDAYSGQMKMAMKGNSKVTPIVRLQTKKVLFLCIAFPGAVNKAKIPIEASFSPDSQLVFTGGADGRVSVWNVAAGNRVCGLDGLDRKPIQCVKFNPEHMMLASAGPNLSFWLPNPENSVH